MTTIQVNFKTTNVLAKQLQNTVDEGLYRSKTEAINEAIRLLLKRVQSMKVKQKILELASKTTGSKVELTKAIIRAHEEEI